MLNKACSCRGTSEWLNCARRFLEFRLAHLYESAGNIDSSEEEDTFVGTGLHIEVAPHRSGKLLVLKQILPLWHQQVRMPNP